MRCWGCVTVSQCFTPFLPSSLPPFPDAPTLPAFAPPAQVLQEKIAFRFKSVRDSFTFYNTEKDGTISEREFRDMLVCIGLDMTEDEYRKLYRHFDRDCDGVISYSEWNNVVGGLIYPLSDISLSRPESPNRIKEWTHRALGRGFINMVKPSTAGGSKDPVADAFREVNMCRSGLISHQEFVQVRAHPRLQLHPPPEAALTPSFSRSHTQHAHTTPAAQAPQGTLRRRRGDLLHLQKVPEPQDQCHGANVPGGVPRPGAPLHDAPHCRQAVP